MIILAELASHPSGTRIPSREIAQRRGIPVNLVIQLLAQLKKAGWAEGTRGPSGGFVLTADPETISLRQVVERVDGPIGITRCLFHDAPCNAKAQCSLRGVWARAQEEMLAVLDEVSIRELASAFAQDL